MIKKSSTYISGVLAFGIYFMLISLLIFYFNTREERKSKRYVKKDEHRIQVALSSPKKVLNKKSSKPKAVKKKVKPKKKIKSKPKKNTKKKVIKEKVVKKVVQKVVKKKDENLMKTKDLFANISPKKKPKLKLEITDKPSASNLVSNSLKKQKHMDSGVEDNYLAKVQSMLEGWPAQSDYAGEKIKVILYINPTGFFEFKLKTRSNNPHFNTRLTEYLEQLQDIGFGRHKGQRTYQFEAEFIAKD